MSQSIPRHYFMTTFTSEHNITHWPIHFAILKTTDSFFLADSSHDTSIPSSSLLTLLKEKYGWARHLTGIDTNSQMTDDYWAVAIGWNEACKLAQSMGLETFFYVSDNTLSVSYSDERRKPVFVDSFLKRFSVENHDG